MKRLLAVDEVKEVRVVLRSLLPDPTTLLRTKRKSGNKINNTFFSIYIIFNNI